MRKFENNVFKKGTKYNPDTVSKADQSPNVVEDSRKRPVSMMPMINDYQNSAKKNHSPQTEIGISKDMNANDNEKG